MLLDVPRSPFVTLQADDNLQFVGLCSPTDSVLIAASNGHVQHFAVSKLRHMGRSAAGVKVCWPAMLAGQPQKVSSALLHAGLHHAHHLQTMALSDGADIVAMAVLPAGMAPEGSIDEDDEDDADATHSGSPGEEEASSSEATTAGPCLLVVTQQGLGKRMSISAFPLRSSRTGKGLKAVRLNPGDRLAAAQVVGAGVAAASGSGTDNVRPSEDVLVSTQQGQLVRVPISSISLVAGRATKGHRVVRVREGDEVVAATLLNK